MQSLQLTLGKEHWSLYMRRKVDPTFRPVRDRIFRRDQYTCQFCGFQAHEYQEILNLDHDYRHNKISNMVTACCLCAQAHFFEMVGQAGFGGGRLIYLPEMSQAELNGFCHVIFCAMTNGTNYRESAQSIYRTLKFRSQPVEERLGLGSSDPAVLGRMLLEYQGKNAETLLGATLSDIRLLASYPRFKKQLLAWAEAASKELAATG
ncbi:MAG: type IV secretion protein IcmJ [Gammaproteobacteria bacterium RIFCSPHIGHO2_02_FULL_42_13]|nr:MAG: type IV secretion protein IcmJ [Gammaproteobacteria bacterium RIFCSPHIGHO2_02_FULL_42_13]OGT67673.1 MAG: type IV secretion protein IcmJ [Gammaproteobacteria bacterium RIFCSPLOWO2_02_FULL_42_9]